jgi:hypothetical protein
MVAKTKRKRRRKLKSRDERIFKMKIGRNQFEYFSRMEMFLIIKNKLKGHLKNTGNVQVASGIQIQKGEKI